MLLYLHNQQYWRQQVHEDTVWLDASLQLPAFTKNQELWWKSYFLLSLVFFSWSGMYFHLQYFLGGHKKAASRCEMYIFMNESSVTKSLLNQGVSKWCLFSRHSHTHTAEFGSTWPYHATEGGWQVLQHGKGASGHRLHSWQTHEPLNPSPEISAVKEAVCDILHSVCTVIHYTVCRPLQTACTLR